jgi:hypothetical protein
MGVNVSFDPFSFEAGGRVSLIDEDGNEVVVGTVTSVEFNLAGAPPHLNLVTDGPLPRTLSGSLTAVPGPPRLRGREGRRVLERLPS